MARTNQLIQAEFSDLSEKGATRHKARDPGKFFNNELL